MDLSLFFSDVMVSSRLGPLQKRFYLRGANYRRELVPPPASSVVRLTGGGWDYTKLPSLMGFEAPNNQPEVLSVCLLLPGQEELQCEVMIP